MTMAACQNELTTEKQIEALQEQVTTDAATLETMSVHYDALNKSYIRCDSMLQYAREDQLQDYFNTLNLANAYLLQFKEISPDMRATFTYTETQLENLLDDLNTQYLSDSLAQVYLAEEAKVADTLHARVLYFQEKLDTQKKAVAEIEKSLKR